MWQRIQTVFLVVGILSLLGTLVMPIWFTEINGQRYVLTPFYFTITDSKPDAVVENGQYIPYALTAIFAVASITLSVLGITKYKNRMTQLKIGALNSFFLVGVILSSYYFSNQLGKTYSEAPSQYGLGMWLPAIAVLCNLLSNRFIRKDEKLVKDSSRLR